MSNKKSFISSSKEEKKEKRGKRDSEEGGRVAGKQGSRRATSLLNLFTSSSSSSPNAQGRFLSLTLSLSTLLSHSLFFSICSFIFVFQQGSIKKKNWLTHVHPFLVSSRRANQQKPYCTFTGATSTHVYYICSFFHFICSPFFLYSFPLFFHNCSGKKRERKNRSFRSLFKSRKV